MAVPVSSDAEAAGIAATAPAAKQPVPADNDGRIDINKADVEQLAALPGVGETIARRIIAFREQHGPFQRVDDLLKVKGIGEKSLAKLRPSVTVGKG